MNKVIINEESTCSSVKVIIVYPELSAMDENVKQEVHEIMVSALHDQIES